MSRIYVASSWRNDHQPAVVALLRELGHEVYDFRHPKDGDDGFSWRQISPDWGTWKPGQLPDVLAHPIARAGFKNDMDALTAAEVTLLVLPCGKSAHLELGYAVGAGQRTAILLLPNKDGSFEPELMYSMVDRLITSDEELAGWARALLK